MKKYIAVLFLFAGACFVKANEEFNFNWANDFWTLQKTGAMQGELSDDNYTNGFHFQYSKEDKDYFVGQDIYTPTILIVDFLVPSDRPYAGFLYAGYADNNYYNDSWLDLPVHAKHKFTGGIVGPSSYAEDVQTTWHKSTSDYTPKGWKYQLKDEPIANYSYFREYDLNWGNKNFKTVPFFEANAGNQLTNFDSGLTLRIGNNLPEFEDRYKNNYWCFFVGGDVDLVAHNIFLDGNTFKDSHSVEKKNVVVRQTYGFEKQWDAFGLRYVLHTASQEFKMQVGDNSKYGGHTYAELNLIYNF